MPIRTAWFCGRLRAGCCTLALQTAMVGRRLPAYLPPLTACLSACVPHACCVHDFRLPNSTAGYGAMEGPCWLTFLSQFDPTPTHTPPASSSPRLLLTPPSPHRILASLVSPCAGPPIVYVQGGCTTLTKAAKPLRPAGGTPASSTRAVWRALLPLPSGTGCCRWPTACGQTTAHGAHPSVLVVGRPILPRGAGLPEAA